MHIWEKASWLYVLRLFFLLKEIALQQVMSHIGAVKKDMIILEKSEFVQGEEPTQLD